MTTELKPADTDAVVLCGGQGSRLGELTKSIPKPLLPLAGYPFLLHLLLGMRREGFSRLILTTHYLADRFQDFVATYARFFNDTIVVLEEKPLGTGGALKNAAAYVQSATFVALNGDSYISQPLVPVLGYHTRMGNAFTMVAAKAENVLGGVVNKGALNIGTHGKIIGFSHSDRDPGWVNAGIYVLDRVMVLSWPSGPYSLESSLMSLLGPREGHVFRSEGRLVDIGTPECYAMANQDPGLFDSKNS